MLNSTSSKIIKRRLVVSAGVSILGLLLYWYTSTSCVPEGVECIVPGSYFMGAVGMFVAFFSFGVLVISVIEFMINIVKNRRID